VKIAVEGFCGGVKCGYERRDPVRTNCAAVRLHTTALLAHSVAHHEYADCVPCAAHVMLPTQAVHTLLQHQTLCRSHRTEHGKPTMASQLGRAHLQDAEEATGVLVIFVHKPSERLACVGCGHALAVCFVRGPRRLLAIGAAEARRETPVEAAGK
jgi:hypothetical protein